MFLWWRLAFAALARTNYLKLPSAWRMRDTDDRHYGLESQSKAWRDAAV